MKIAERIHFIRLDARIRHNIRVAKREKFVEMLFFRRRAFRFPWRKCYEFAKKDVEATKWNGIQLKAKINAIHGIRY